MARYLYWPVGAFCGHVPQRLRFSEPERLRPTLDFLLPFPLSEVLGLRKGIYRQRNLDRLRWRRPTGQGWLIVICYPCEAAQEQSLHTTADMYTYTAGATGLDASMPPSSECGAQSGSCCANSPPQKPDAKLTPDVARELCLRAGSASTLYGSIAQIGTPYLLTLRAA